MTGEILRQYTEVRMNERLDFFLQYPELRRPFQEIDRKEMCQSLGHCCLGSQPRLDWKILFYMFLASALAFLISE